MEKKGRERRSTFWALRLTACVSGSFYLHVSRGKWGGGGGKGGREKGD